MVHRAVKFACVVALLLHTASAFAQSPAEEMAAAANAFLAALTPDQRTENVF